MTSKYHTLRLCKPDTEEKIQDIVSYLPAHKVTDYLCYYMAMQCMKIGAFDCYNVETEEPLILKKWFEARKHTEKTEFGYKEFVDLYFYERSGKKGYRSYETAELFI